MYGWHIDIHRHPFNDHCIFNLHYNDFVHSNFKPFVNTHSDFVEHHGFDSYHDHNLHYNDFDTQRGSLLEPPMGIRSH